MAAYNFRERKLVLGNDQATNTQNIQKYLQDEDYYKLTSESGLQRQLYLDEKLADYIANPEHAATQHRTKLEEIEKDTKEIFNKTLQRFLAAGIPLSESKARAYAVGDTFIRTQMQAIEAEIPSDILARATDSQVSVSNARLKGASIMMKQIKN